VHEIAGVGRGASRGGDLLDIGDEPIRGILASGARICAIDGIPHRAHPRGQPGAERSAQVSLRPADDTWSQPVRSIHLSLSASSFKALPTDPSCDIVALAIQQVRLDALADWHLI
jgi:hypothetical protein